MRTNSWVVWLSLLGFLTSCSGEVSEDDELAASSSELVLPAPVCPPTFVVTTTLDRASSCQLGNCSLREAVMAANSCLGFNTIEVPAGEFELTLASSELDPPSPTSASYNDLDILEPVRIVGASNGGTVLRSSVPGFFQVHHLGNSTTETVLESLTLDGTGQAVRGVRIGDGGLTSHPRVAVRNSHFHSFGAGAIEASAGSKLRALDSGFEANLADEGSAIRSEADELEVSSCRFGGNSSWFGGALWVQGPALAVIQKSTFESNSSTHGSGGAILSHASLDVRDSTFSSNKSFGNGGALTALRALNVQRSTFLSNWTKFDGGAISQGGLSQGHYHLLVADCTFSHNAAAVRGGALSTKSNFQVNVSTSQFDFNESVIGGALSVFLFVQPYALHVARSSFVGNRAQQGGAIYDNGDATVANTTFSGNSAREGGAIYAHRLPLQLKSSTLFGNESDKGVLLAANTGAIELTHSIVSNDPAGVGSSQLCNAQGSSASIQSLGHNFFQDESCAALPSDTFGPDPQLRPLELRPASNFIKLASHHPEQNSPVADHGSLTASSTFGDDTCAPLDVWGRSRPVRADDSWWLPPSCDIGAVEVHPELP